MHSQSKHPKNPSPHSSYQLATKVLKTFIAKLKKQTKKTNKGEKKYFSVNYIYILYIYTFVLLYQPNIMYFLCCYGRGPWQHHGNGTIKIKTLIPQLHPARVFLFICCVFSLFLIRALVFRTLFLYFEWICFKCYSFSVKCRQCCFFCPNTLRLCRHRLVCLVWI